MTFTYPGLFKPLETDGEKVNCVVIENKKYYVDLLTDISSQLQGLNGDAVVSSGGKISEFARSADLLASFFPFDLNRKSLISKITSALEKNAMSAENYEKTVSFLTAAERYLDDISVDFSCDLIYNKLNVSSFVRSAGIEVADDSASLPEKLLNYMQLVREFECNKLFLAVNLRSFMDDGMADSFLESVIMHKYDLIMFDNTAYPLLKNERRLTVDADLCCF